MSNLFDYELVVGKGTPYHRTTFASSAVTSPYKRPPHPEFFKGRGFYILLWSLSVISIVRHLFDDGIRKVLPILVCESNTS